MRKEKCRRRIPWHIVHGGVRGSWQVEGAAEHELTEDEVTVCMECQECHKYPMP